MARRSDHTRKELKVLILDKAWEIVGKNGIDNLTARNLAKEIGYAPGTVYNLFDSMDALHLQLNLKTVDLLYRSLAAHSAKLGRNVRLSDMEDMAQAYFNFATDYRSHWLMLFNLKVNVDENGARDYQKAIEQLFSPLESLLFGYFPDKEDKEIKKAARVLWSSVHGLCYLQQSDKIEIIESNEKAFTLVNYLIEIFIKGMQSDGGR